MFATIQMVDVHLPTTDGRHLVLPRHTRPNKEHELLLHQLGMTAHSDAKRPVIPIQSGQ